MSQSPRLSFRQPSTRSGIGLSEIDAARAGVEEAAVFDDDEDINNSNDLGRHASTVSRSSRRMSTGLHPVDTHSSGKSGHSHRNRRYSGLAEVDAPAPIQDETETGLSYTRSFLEDERQREGLEEREEVEREKEEPRPPRDTKKEWRDLITTFCWLIFFSIWGALARIGLSAVTTYPGSPLFGVIWANFAGCFVMGFMAEEVRFFAAVTVPSSDEGEEKEEEETDEYWSIDKKAIPLYIGITTGFCGSLTSFSTWMRDIFWALSNTEPAYPRHIGYNVEALLAEIIATIALSLAGFKAGAQAALLLRPIIPTMHREFRPFLDLVGIFLGIACWIGVIIMSIFIAKWRRIALFAGLFAPLGTMLRFMASRKLNPKIPSFPLGTFTVNVSGSILDAIFILLQHYSATSIIGCELLQGLEDGLCGCLTTVSTWVVEISSLRRTHAYKYGSISILCGVFSFVLILGTYTWDRGLDARRC